MFSVVEKFAKKFLDEASNSLIPKVFSAVEVLIRSCPELTKGTETIFGLLMSVISDIERRRRTGTEIEMRYMIYWVLHIKGNIINFFTQKWRQESHSSLSFALLCSLDYDRRNLNDILSRCSKWEDIHISSPFARFERIHWRDNTSWGKTKGSAWQEFAFCFQHPFLKRRFCDRRSLRHRQIFCENLSRKKEVQVKV